MDCTNELVCKINELVVAVNKLSKQLIDEPKTDWAVGDTFYYLSFNDFMYNTTIEEATITYHGNTDEFLRNLNSGKDPNIFKSREGAKNCLDEILEVLKKYG